MEDVRDPDAEAPDLERPVVCSGERPTRLIGEVAFRLTIGPLTHVKQRRSRRFKGKGYFLNGVEGNVALLPFDAAEIGLGQSGAQGNLFLRDSKLCPADPHIAGEKLTQRKRVERVHCDRDS